MSIERRRVTRVTERVVDGELRCRKQDCEGRFGKPIGIWLNPGAGWWYDGGEPQEVLLGEFGRYEGGKRQKVPLREVGLVGGTWRPTKRALFRWRHAYADVSAKRASDALK